MKHAGWFATAAVAGLIALPTAPRADEPVTLKFAWPAPMGTDSSDIAMAWKDDVVKAAGGALKVTVFPGASIAKTTNVLDRIENGVADFGFGIFGPYSRAYPQTFVVELPFACKNSTECSTALWRLNASGVTAAEYKRFHPLALFCFTGASLQSTKPVRKLEDMQGLKIAASGKVMADDLKLMGAAAVTITPADFFEALNRGVINGALISWPGATSFKLDEVSKYHMSTPFGLFPAFVMMNTGSYKRLPDKVRQAFDKYSGEAFSKRYGEGLDVSNDKTIGEFKKMKGHEVVELSDAELARWEKVLAPITDDWAKHTPDGPHVLSAFRAEIKKIRSGS